MIVVAQNVKTDMNLKMGHVKKKKTVYVIMVLTIWVVSFVKMMRVIVMS